MLLLCVLVTEGMGAQLIPTKNTKTLNAIMNL